FAIEKTSAEIDADRQEVLNEILPVYRKVTYIAERNIEDFKRNFDLLWKANYASNPNRSSNLKAGLQLLEEFYNTGIIEIRQGDTRRKSGNSLTLVENNVAGNVN